MGKLLKYELRKLFSSKFLYIITAIFTARAVLQAITLAFIENSSLSTLVNSSLYGFFALYVLFVGAWIAPTFISPDYSSGGILPNVVSRGYSRIQVFLAKYISLIVLHVFAFVVSSAIGIIVGLPLVRDRSGTVMNSMQLDQLLKMFIACFATLSLQVLFSVVCRRKSAVFFSILSTNPFLALIVCFLPFLSPNGRFIPWLSKFIMDWYVPFAYIKLIISNAFEQIGASSVIKVDFSYLVISSIIMFALSFGGSIWVVSRKEISK